MVIRIGKRKAPPTPDWRRPSDFPAGPLLILGLILLLLMTSIWWLPLIWPALFAGRH